MTAWIRPALSTDAGTTGGILHGFLTQTPWMPELWTGAETIAFCGTMIERGWVTVAEVDGQVEGFIARDGEEICALYLSRNVKGQGIGKMLLDNAKGASDRLNLRVFQANAGAQRFYRREGFVETERGDGSGNDEGLPDLRMEWVKETSK